MDKRQKLYQVFLLKNYMDYKISTRRDQIIMVRVTIKTKFPVIMPKSIKEKFFIKQTVYNMWILWLLNTKHLSSIKIIEDQDTFFCTLFPVPDSSIKVSVRK